jgi:hypothetical protein
MVVHLYESIDLEPANFQSEVSLYATRNESFSGNVATIHKIQDEHIAFNEGLATMQVTLVTDYVPWRLHLASASVTLTYEQALFLLEGAVSGFRELLHKTKTPFLIEQYMVGVDGNGKVKVWWNEHFFRNKFSFKLTSDVKLKDMVLSLVCCLTSKMNEKDAEVFRSNLLRSGEMSFVTLEREVREMSKGLNLQVIGKNLI